MTSHERNVISLMREIAAPYGLSVEVQTGGKHLAAVIAHPDGRWHKFPVSSSPRSASCQLRQVRQQVTSWLESAGFETGRGEAGERRTRRKRGRTKSTITRLEVLVEPDSGPARDPWAALRQAKDQAA